jgi:hypothetical protein
MFLESHWQAIAVQLSRRSIELERSELKTLVSGVDVHGE